MMSLFPHILVVVCCLVFLAREVDGQYSLTTLYASSSTSTITSNSPQPYTANQLSEWRLHSAGGSDRIVLSITFINLEWRYDILEIYDGLTATSTRLYYSRYDRTPSSVIVSSGSNLYLRFASDYSIQYTGFDISFISVPSVPASCSASLTPSAYLTASTSDQTTYYYYNYIGTSCSITITTSSASNRIEYSVPVSNNQTFSVVDNGHSQSLTTGASTYVSTSSSIYFNGNSGNEFVVVYKEVSSMVTANIVTAASIVSTSICISSGTTLPVTTSTQYLTSTNYPYNYNNYDACYVTLTSTDSSKSIQLIVTDWEVNYDDFVALYDGPTHSYTTLYTTNTFYTTLSITSTGSSLHLEFYTSDSGTTRGFQMTYTQTFRGIPTCTSPVSYTSLTATTSSQTITSPNYPANYDNNHDLYWLIQKPTETDNLVMDITDMSIEDAISCRYDVLSLYDGACNDNTLIASVCGTQAATFEDSTGLYVLVRFKTDGYVVGSGFNMTYKIGPFENDEESDVFDDVKDWLIPLIVLLIIIALVIALVVGCLLHKRRVRMRKVRDTSTAEQKQKPKLARKLTTHQLLHQFKTSYQARNARKTSPPIPQPDLHPVPNPPGPNTIIMDRSQMTPHPAPQPAPPPPQFDPVYPPGGNMHMDPINPAMPPGYSPYGQMMARPVIPEGTIPPSFTYITPTQARDMHAAAQQGQPM